MKAGGLTDYVSWQAQERPDRVALVNTDGSVMTYHELDRLSNGLAWRLREAGCQKGDRIALLLRKSTLAIVSMVGTLKAGCIYVPMDVDSPRSRLDLILQSSDSRFLLATASSGTLAGQLLSTTANRTQLGWLDDSSIQVQAESSGPAHSIQPAFTWSWAEADDAPPGPGHSTDVAHLLFTSGSTGRPKGVMITHANVISYIEWSLGYFVYSPEDRISGHPPLHFDLSTMDIYTSLAAGAQLHLVPSHLNLMPQKIADFIRQRELTQWFSVPSLLSYMAKFDVVGSGDFPSLRRLLWCGERFPTPALRYWMQRLPHVEFTNLYGPTEATIASSYYRVPVCPPSDDTPIPIGVPCAGESLLVLDEKLARTPEGVIGDLYIGGVGLSPGYWNDEEKTRAAFLEQPFGAGSERIYRTGDLASLGPDGLVYLHGRCDAQIKSRGYRIELGEIEVALQTIPGIGEAAVVAIENNGFEGATICCAVVPARDASYEPQTFRQRLAERLPSYMLPARWLPFESLPLNGNGKVDKPLLRERFQASASPGPTPVPAAATPATH